MQKSPYEIYTHHKVSDEILLQMCKDVDKEAGKAKPKHPLTSEEEKNKEYIYFAIYRFSFTSFIHLGKIYQT